MEKWNRREAGQAYENLACSYLISHGLVILQRNFRCRLGEIDLIARDGPVLVFVEVKSRSGKGAGESLWAVTTAKQKKIGRIALFYMAYVCKRDDLPTRFDVVGIDRGKITWIKNAFDFSGARGYR